MRFPKRRYPDSVWCFWIPLQIVLNTKLSTKCSAGILPAFLLLVCLSPALTHAQSSEITLYAGGFLGDTFISTPPVLTGPVVGTFDDQVTVGFRYAYFFVPQLAAEFGVGFTPTNVVTVSRTSGGTDVRSVIDVDTYVVHGNLTAHLVRGGHVIPYVTGGVGAVHFGYSIDPYGFLTPSETDFALNAGGGVKFPIRKTTALRFDSRVYWVDSEFAPQETSTFVEITGGVSILFDF